MEQKSKKDWRVRHQTVTHNNSVLFLFLPVIYSVAVGKLPAPHFPIYLYCGLATSTFSLSLTLMSNPVHPVLSTTGAELKQDHLVLLS